MALQIKDISIRVTFQGALVLSALHNDQWYERQYMGYTKREALSMFRQYVLGQ